MGTHPNGSGPASARTAAPELKLVPKEHGASFMAVHSLLLGIVAGFAAGGDDWAGLGLAVAFGVLFLPLTAAISVITLPRLAAPARRRTSILGSLFVLVGALSLVHGPATELLGLGGPGVVLGGLYTLARARTGARSIASQLAAIASISLLAPLAWVLIAGPTDRWLLAAPAAFLAFGGTVPYVRERVRRRRFADMTVTERLRGGAVAIGWQAIAVTSASALALAEVAHPLLPIAFVPGAVKTTLALVRAERKPPIKRIGYLETGVSTVFSTVAGIALGIAP